MTLPRIGMCAVGLLLLATRFATARPPDLPIDTKDVCIPVLWPQWLPQQPQYIPPSPQLERPSVFSLPFVAKPVETRPVIDLRKLAEARRLFRIGERCRRDGDLDMAVSCYQEVELIYPDCAYGRLAAERLRQLLPEVSAANQPQTNGDVIRETEADLARLTDARHMFEIGQRCERGSDLDSARRCYEEAHRICPGSRYGKEAAARALALHASPPSVEQTVFGIGTFADIRRHWRMMTLADWCDFFGFSDTAARYYREAYEARPENSQKAIERLLEIERQRILRP